MNELQKAIRRTQRRLALQRFVEVLGWCWFAGLTAAMAVILVGKFYPLRFPEWASVALGSGLSLLAALAWTVAKRPKTFDAALEIDRRYNLKERVSSTVALRPEDHATEAGRALVDDALRRVGRLDLGDKFRLAVPWQFFLPLLPGVLALLVALLVQPSTTEGSLTPATTAATPAQKLQIKHSTDDLRRKLVERRQDAEKQGLKDATKLLKRLEEGTKQLAAEPQRDKALVKLNDLARQLRTRRAQLGGAEKIKQQLEQLKNIDRGPADKLAGALSHGDFEKAADELQKMMDQLANDKLDGPQKEALAKQLEKMQEKIKEMAAAHQAAQRELQKKVDALRQAGQQAEADKLQQQFDKLADQAPQMQQMQDMGKQLGQCAKCMKQGNGKQAAKALAQAQAQLKNLQQQQKELAALDGAMEQLGEAREQMTCPECDGKGGACQGEMPNDGKPGNHLGQGPGFGPRPEAKTATATYDSQVRQKVGRGSGTVTDLVSGPNVKGKVEAEIQQQFDTTRHGSTDPLTGRQIPRKHSEHAREYFDLFREGKAAP